MKTPRNTAAPHGESVRCHFEVLPHFPTSPHFPAILGASGGRVKAVRALILRSQRLRTDSTHRISTGLYVLFFRRLTIKGDACPEEPAQRERCASQGARTTQAPRCGKALRNGSITTIPTPPDSPRERGGASAGMAELFRTIANRDERRDGMIEMRWESACKPGSVMDSHSSRISVAGYLKRPTREHARAARRRASSARSSIWSCSGWGLPCHWRCRQRGALLPHHFTLTSRPEGSEAVSFLWHFPWTRAPQALPGTLPCGARTFLPHPHAGERDCPANSQTSV